VPTNLHTALTKPSSSKQKTDTKLFYNQIVVKKQNKFACRKGKYIMKKIVSIVLTTGLLMGTVAFSALACDRKENGPDQFQAQKKMGQHERYQPSKKHQHCRRKAVITIIKAISEPAPAPAPRVRKPTPSPGHGQRVMPQPGPERWTGRD
jgi:hypothetical protein